MLASMGWAVVPLLLLAGEPSGFERGGIGLELGGEVSGHASEGTNWSRGLLFPQLGVTARLRIGRDFSIGVSGEYVSGVAGGPGDDFDYERKQIAVEVQYRWMECPVPVKPWASLGMAWGTIHEESRDEPLPTVDAHLWEFARLGLGLDIVLHPAIAFGPAFRVGFASTKGVDPYIPPQNSLTTYTFGFRVTVAMP